MTEKQKNKTIDVSTKSFVSAMIVIYIMMLLTYGLTFLIPGGGISFWKWLFSPILVLFEEDNDSLIRILVLLLVLGGSFSSLEKFGILKILLDKITEKFRHNKKLLLAIIPLFFMFWGSVAGTYEECVPLVPVVVALAIRFGWDALTGLGMSILAAGCGFAAGLCNPFTVGIAQEVAGLPMFSGIWFRMVGFVLIYLLLISFLFFYVKRWEKKKEGISTDNIEEDKSNHITDFGQKSKLKQVILSFSNGVVMVLPGVVLILMANSIRFTLMEGNVLDYLLQTAVFVAEKLPSWSVILFIYALILVMNFFIPSGSAKVFLCMPLILPMAQALGISPQLCILAFAFGDGFSNVFYPTNPVLLISLGLANINYGDWVKWSFKFQIPNLILTSLLLLLGLSVGYN